LGNIKLALAATALMAFVPAVSEAAISSVTIDTQRPYENASNYTYAEITIHGTVARGDGTNGVYTVPAIVIYPNSGGNDVGVVDWINNAFYHFYPATTEFGQFQFTLLATDSYLFDQGYTYMSISWDKAVFAIFGATPPNDGLPHNHMAYGALEHSADAFEVVLDAARLLKSPYAHGPRRVHTVFSQGYSQSAAFQLEVLTGNHDPTHQYDGHLITMIGAVCWKRDDVAPHFGFLDACSAPLPTSNHGNVITLVSESDMSAFGGFFLRNSGDPNWRQYEIAGIAHIPKTIVDLGVPNQSISDAKPVFRSAYQNLTLWTRLGVTPPGSKYLDGTVDGAGNFVPVPDADGNWLGGLRLPHVTSTVAGHPAGAPLGVNGGLNPAGVDPFNIFLWLGGTFTRFSDTDLASRYPTRLKYVERVSLAAAALGVARYLTVADVQALIHQSLVEPLPGLRDGTEADLEALGEDESGVEGGCSTTSGGTPASMALIGLALLLNRRRRR